MYEASQRPASPYCRNKIVFHNFASFPTQHVKFGKDRAKLCVLSVTCLPAHVDLSLRRCPTTSVRPGTEPRHHGAHIHRWLAPAAILPATTACHRRLTPRVHARQRRPLIRAMPLSDSAQDSGFFESSGASASRLKEPIMFKISVEWRR